MQKWPNTMKRVTLKGKKPVVESGAFVAPTAVLIGDVTVESGANIWYGAVLRGDLGSIVVKAGASVQDNVVIHVQPQGQTLIEENVIIGHGVVLHNCVIKRGAIVGINSVVLDYATVGEEAVVAAGSVVSSKSEIPPRHLAAGIPAKSKKELSGDSLWYIQQGIVIYNHLVQDYLDDGIGVVKDVEDTEEPEDK